MESASPSRRSDSTHVPPHRENARQRSRHVGPIALALCLCALCLCAIVVAATLGVHVAFAAPLADTTPYTGHWTQPAATDDIPAADESTGIGTYQSQYGFFAPHAASIASDEQTRLAVLVPYARVAAARVNSRYGAHLQPQMVLWWTHADGIRANVNYSNCANEADQYFSHIHNCDKPWFWQLGAAADQFSYVVYLPQAVDDMYGAGASENAALMQRLGQQVLDFDQHIGTTPACGGYSCTFPSTTISRLMQTVSLQAQTDGNWYASLLMRDPGIGSWMTARALRTFSRDQTKGWVGCYYAASCWQRLSDRMGDILSAWPQLVQTAQALGPGDPVKPTVTPTATTSPTDTATPTPTATDTPSPTPADTATPTATDTPSPTPADTPTDAPTKTTSPTATDTPPRAPVAPIPCRLPVSGVPFALTWGTATGTPGVAENTPCFYDYGA